MQIPVILSRGYSLDKSIWTDWFDRQHEQYRMEVKYRSIEGGAFEIRVEISILGVPVYRGLFGYADSRSSKAYYQIKTDGLSTACLWLNEAFEVEVVQQAAPLLDMTRRMGLVYIQPEQQDDVNQYFFDQVDKLGIQYEHQAHENAPEVEVPRPSSYSAFADAVDHLDMPFDQTYDGDENDD